MLKGYYSGYSYVVTDSDIDLGITEFVSEEEAIEYYELKQRKLEKNKY